MSTGIRRGEIYMVDLKESYKYCISGLHPVLIISHYKHLLKSDLIQILPITSNINKICKSHIKLGIENGLLKDCKIETEQILTINKEDLRYKVATLDNLTMLKVNKKINQQLQTDGKFNNLEVKDLEKLFFENSNNQDKKTLEKLKEDIHITFNFDKDFNKAIELCNRLDNLAKKSMIDDKNYYIWYSSYTTGIANLYLNNIQEAKKYIEQSLMYVYKPTEFSIEYSLSLWGLGRIYDECGDVKKAKEIYFLLSKYYRNNNEKMQRIQCLFNISTLDKDVKNMKKLIMMLEGTNCNYKNKYNTDFYKTQILQQMQEILEIIQKQ